MALLHIKNFHVMLCTLTTFKKKTSTCGSQVDHIYVGHIWITLWVSGSHAYGSPGVTHFQPWPLEGSCFPFQSVLYTLQVNPPTLKNLNFILTPFTTVWIHSCTQCSMLVVNFLYRCMDITCITY